MTHRRFQNPNQGYDRREAERDELSSVEADMLFDDAATQQGLESLMGGAPQAAPAKKSGGPAWDLPQDLGKAEVAPMAEPGFELDEVTPQAMVQQPVESVLETPDEPMAELPEAQPVDATDEKITTVVRRSRSESRNAQKKQKKKGFFKRMFGG